MVALAHQLGFAEPQIFCPLFWRGRTYLHGLLPLARHADRASPWPV